MHKLPKSRKIVRKRKMRRGLLRGSLFKFLTVGLTTLVLAVSLHFVAAAPSKGVSLPSLYGANPGTNVVPNALTIKLQPGIVVNEQAGTISGGDAAQVAALNKYLVTMKRNKLGRIISAAVAAKSPRVASAVERYYTVTFSSSINVVQVAQQLQTAYSSVIASAYPVAQPVPNPSTTPIPTIPSYTADQNYLSLAPTGDGAVYARNFPGGKGDDVRLTDIEYSWNTNHVDLTSARNALVPNGTPLVPQGGDNVDHGTKVLGMIASQDNGFGTTGGTPNVTLSLINAWNTDANSGVDPLASALGIAESISSPGDVVLIELQTTGPTGKYVPIEWAPAEYDAIKALTDKGVIVVEPAANGSQNLDDTVTYGSPFPLGKPDSGAIMVGGGVNCYYSTNRLSPEYYTDYGSRVNVQGAGDCVTTTGNGNLYQTTDPNQEYYQNFDGTSSASADIASAAASLSSAYKQLNGGQVLTPAQIRNILMTTGSPESTAAPYGATEAIGPLPNLQKALQVADNQAPTAPTAIKLTLNSNHKPVITWSGATDNVAVTSYKLYRNGSVYKTLTTTSFTDTAAIKGKTYSYKVVAYDDAGHASPASNTVKLTVK